MIAINAQLAAMIGIEGWIFNANDAGASRKSGVLPKGTGSRVEDSIGVPDL